MMERRWITSWLFRLALLAVVLPVSSPAAVGPNWIEQWGIRWTFDRNLSATGAVGTYRYGTYVNGDYWVVGPVTITSISPPSLVVLGRTINGSMLNPAPGSPQGYDSGAYGWTPSLNAALGVSPADPLVIGVSDYPIKSLISTISTAVVSEKESEPRLQGASILTIVATVPSADAFRPPYCGQTKFAEIRAADIDRSCLASLPPVSGTPPLSESEEAFERPWLDHGGNYPGEVMHPINNMPWYGRNMARTAGIAALQLNLNYAPSAKETLLKRFLQYGIDVSGVIACPEARKIWTGNGGITNGRKLAGVFAAQVLNHPQMIAQHAKSGKYLYEVNGYGPGNPPPDYIHFGNEDDQVFYISQVDVDATHSPLWHPDPNDAELVRYTPSDIGYPEWGIRHAADPWYSNYWWETNYRSVSGCTMPGSALAAHIMGMKTTWNTPAFFDYCDRYMATIADGTIYAGKGWQWGANGIDLFESSRFVWNMWHTYREDYGPVWSGPPVILRGDVWSWGKQDLYKNSMPGITQVSAGGSHSLALLSDGSLLGWGDATHGQSIVPDGNDFIAVSAGGSHSLVLLSNGTLTAWGDNSFGQAAAPSGNDFVAVSAGEAHNLALTSDGYLAGWGDNTYGQTTVPDGNDFVAIAAGGFHSLALLSDGTLMGWGDNTYGQTTVPDGNDFVAVSAGGFHSLALRSDGSIVGWGDNGHGQVTAPDGADFLAVSAGGVHSLAITSDGSLVGWGDNTYGQVTPPEGTGFKALAAGAAHSLALRSDGSIAGWGNNTYGQATPPAGTGFTAIAAGDYHSLALRSDGTIVCWGNNSDGQATAPGGNSFVAIAAGRAHSLALRSDGSIVGWGNNNYGQATPPLGITFGAIAAGSYHSLAIESGCGYRLGGDLTQDCRVDLADLAEMAANWLVDCLVNPADPACVQQ